MFPILRYKADMEKRSTKNFNGCKAEIVYPCRWQYKLIGTEEQAMREAVALHVKDPGHTLKPSRVSSGGRYVSMNLEVLVDSEQDRLDLYHKLAAHRAVKVVL